MSMTHLFTFRNAVTTAAILIALWAATYRLTEAPGIWYDEGFYTQVGANAAELGVQGMQIAPHTFAPTSYITVGYPLLAPLVFAYKIDGVGVLQGRVVMIVFMFVFLALAYILVRKLYGADMATWSLLMLATFPMLYGTGKSVLGEVPGLAYLLATLASLAYLEQRHYRGWKQYALVGLCAGLCVATKPLFLLVLGALAVALILKWQCFTLDARGVAAGSFALIGCLILWVYIQFGSDASITAVLKDYANPYSTSDILQLVLHNLKRFITESTPLYTLFLMLGWSVALWLRRLRNIPAAELAAYGFCILVIISYLRLPGWYRYLFPATLTSLVFFAPSLVASYDWLQRYMPMRKQFAVLPYTLLATLAALQLYQTAFSSYVAEQYGATRTRDASAALAALLPNTSVYLYNVPELVILLPTREYFQYVSPLPTVIIGSSTLPVLLGGNTDIAIATADAYQAHAELFSHYAPIQTFDRYIMLKRQ
jgi:hypothetical protein